MREFNIKLAISLVGAVIFLFALMGRSFFSSINDMFIAPKVEMYIATIVDVDKHISHFVDSEGKKYAVYTTNYTVEFTDGRINLTSKKYNDYKNLAKNDKIQIYKYDDKYSLTRDEFGLPPVLKIVFVILMFIGAAMGVFPWMPEDRYGVHRYNSW